MDIKISADDPNDEWRIPRLQMVKSIVSILKGGDMITGDVTELHDHEGLLTVSWDSNPSEHDKSVLAKVWDLQNEYDIAHQVKTL